MGTADADPVFRSNFKKVDIPGRCLAQFSERPFNLAADSAAPGKQAGQPLPVEAPGSTRPSGSVRIYRGQRVYV